MRLEPLSPRSLFHLRSGQLGRVVLLSLPFIFLFGSGLATLLSAFYLLRYPLALPKLLGTVTNYSIFSTQPPTPAVMGESYVPKEARPLILKRFLESYHSPLAPHANSILEVSTKYNLDWRLLTAIAGNESLFGRVVPHNSYNAWGWGVHSQGTVRFGSWEEGMERVARSLRQDFLDQGLITLELIMSRYAPVSVENDYPWADNVRYFMERLEEGKGYRE